MKKNLTILASVVLIAAGCASWHKDESSSSTTMSEPAGAERSSGASASGSMRTGNSTNNVELNTSGSTNGLNSSGSIERQDRQSTQPQQQQ